MPSKVSGLNIITLNCYQTPYQLPIYSNRNKRLNATVTELLKIRPNIICLQEIVLTSAANKIDKVFKSKGYHTFYSPDFFLNKGGLFLATTLDIAKAKFKRFKYQGIIISRQSQDRILGKGYQKLSLKYPEGNLTLINVHLASTYHKTSGMKRRIYTYQLKQLTKGIKSIKEHLIVTGDFNFVPNDPLYQDFLDKTQLTNPSANTRLMTNSTRNSFIKKRYREKDNQLDFTFISADLKSKTQRLILDNLFKINKREVHLSDHFGLFTEFSLIDPNLDF